MAYKHISAHLKVFLLRGTVLLLGLHSIPEDIGMG